MNKSVYVLDDEQDIIDLVSLHLRKSGFSAEGFTHPADLFARLRTDLPSLVILDLMLPDKNGIEVCRSMKSDSRLRSIPVIMLTAKRDEADKVTGLDSGADDYIVKPFSPKELIARVRAVLRRGKTDDIAEVMTIAGILQIDLQKHTVKSNQSGNIDLTNTEFKILVELARKRGWVLSREQLLRAVWGDEAFVVDRNIDVHIRHLREKLGDAARLIVNIRGVGYKIEE
jgi:DNA-binding response OmpR family regulator